MRWCTGGWRLACAVNDFVISSKPLEYLSYGPFVFCTSSPLAACDPRVTNQSEDTGAKARPTSPFGYRSDDLTLRSRYLLRRTAP